ncbi:hypothetical protein pb186bvf_009654 [Paramecium bursaria]
MFQTHSSINSVSQSPQKFKFKSKVSFFNDHLPPQQTTTRISMQYTEQLKMMIETFSSVSFTSFPEYQNLKSNQMAVSIQSCFNPKFQSTGIDETKDGFQDLIDEIKQTVQRKYPFVKIIRHTIDHPENFLQIQIYQPDQLQVVLYNKEIAKQLPTAKLIGDAVWLYLKKFNLTVNVDCINKNAVPVCEDQNTVNILEGLKVTVRQKEGQTLQNVQTPTKQIVIRTSFCQPSTSAQKSASKIDIFKSTDNIKDMEKSVRVYFSPTKTQTWMTQTQVANIDLKRSQPEKKFTVKLFCQSQLTNCFEEAKFQDLIQQVSSYEIEISGETIKTINSLLNVDEILTNQEQLYVSTRVERTDILKCLIKAPEDAVVYITKNQQQEQLTYDADLGAFSFWGRVQQEYLIDVTKKDCFPQKKQLFIQGNSDCLIEFDMVSCVETTLQFKAYNIILKQNQNKEIEQVKLELLQSDQIDQEPLVGYTDNGGMFTCPGLMFKQVKVHAKRKGFLSINYDFDVRANSTGQIMQIPMIPDFYSLINQYHILIYIPNKTNFQMDYSMVCPDGFRLDQKTRSHPVMKSKLEINRITQSAVLWNFSVHVQSLDPFLKDNCFQFFVANQKPKRTLMCQEPLSPQFKENQQGSAKSHKSLNINEMFLKTRVMQTEIKSFVRQESDVIAQKINNYCAEESVRIFVTFGHKVIDTLMIQANLLNMNEKCYGVIDLDKRQFIRDNDTLHKTVQRNLSKMPTFKREVEQEDRKLSTILSHITNQKFID